VVREEGFEPSRSFLHGILSPARLPVPPLSRRPNARRILAFPGADARPSRQKARGGIGFIQPSQAQHLPGTERRKVMDIELEARRFARVVCLALLVEALVTAGAAAQTYELVHAFRNSGQPRSGLIQASDSYFYGTTYFGGTCGVGATFGIDFAGSVTTLHSFCYSDGAHPAAGLIQSDSGDFYGTTTRGGTSNLGTIFRMDSSGNVTVMHSFHGSDGAVPDAALQRPRRCVALFTTHTLVQADDGVFYGTTVLGGEHGSGTGTTTSGGAPGADGGTIFRIDF
jgi:uncharacterized repeat protein (TIGR03803 family)